MKKILIVIGIVLLFFLTAVYLVFDFFFPKAEKFDYPDYSSVESITISRNNEAVSLTGEDAEILYEYISKVKPTRLPSVEDSPGSVPYYTIIIKSEDISYFGHGYIYEKYGVTYFELPYVGIYTLDSNVMSYIKKQY